MGDHTRHMSNPVYNGRTCSPLATGVQRESGHCSILSDYARSLAWQGTQSMRMESLANQGGQQCPKVKTVGRDYDIEFWNVAQFYIWLRSW